MTDKKSLIYISNKLVQAHYKLTLNEQRLILACIAQIKDPREPITRDTEFIIDVPSFSRLFRVPIKSSYADVNEAATSLLSRVVTIENPDPDNPKLLRTKTGWVSYADYYEGRVVIKFREKITPYISELKKGFFTKYHLQRVAMLKSTYAIRLYSILMSEEWRHEALEIKVETLKAMYGLDDDEYCRIYDFKRFIIAPSVKGINKHTDINVTYSQKKQGRVVTHFVFKYTVKQQKPETKKQTVTDTLINKHARPGESRQQVINRLNKMIEAGKEL